MVGKYEILDLYNYIFKSFFFSKSYALTVIPPYYSSVTPDIISEVGACYHPGGNFPATEPQDCSGTAIELLESQNDQNFWDCYYNPVEIIDGNAVASAVCTSKINGSKKYPSATVYYRVLTAESKSCPQDLGTYFYQGTEYCVHYNVNYKDPDCPVESTLFVGGVSNNHTVKCYDVSEYRQCQIVTSETGSYNLPSSLGNQEPVPCKIDSSEPIEPPEDPVEPPEDPVEPPKDPVEPPEDPIEPPKDPVEPPHDFDFDYAFFGQHLTRITSGITKVNQNLDKYGISIGNSIDDSNDILSDSLNTQKTIDTRLYHMKDSVNNISNSSRNIASNTSITNEKLDQLIENTSSFQGTTQIDSNFDSSKSQSFYSSEYPNGLEGVWSSKSSEFKQTETFNFLQQFAFNAGGSPPDTEICFNLGSHMDFGCADLPTPSSQLLAILKVFILITAAFLCRALIFGG